MSTAFLAGQPVTVEIPLIDDYGVAFEASAVQYRVSTFDGPITEKVAVPGFSEGDGEVTLTIGGVTNTIDPSRTREIRIIELFVTTEFGSHLISHEFMVEAESTLIPLVNTFQSYANAMTLSWDMVGMTGWAEAPKREKIAALVQARNSICKLAFNNVADIGKVSEQEWSALDPDFREALFRAQVIEANALLGGYEVEDIRKSGLMSMTVGEAKQFFRPGRPIETMLHRLAMRELRQWISMVIKIGRVS